MASSSWILTWWERQRCSMGSLRRAKILCMRSPHHPVAPHLQILSHWGLGFRIRIWWGGHKYLVFSDSLFSLHDPRCNRCSISQMWKQRLRTEMTWPRSPGRQVSKLGFGLGQPHSGKHCSESVLLGLPCPVGVQGVPVGAMMCPSLGSRGPSRHGCT